MKNIKMIYENEGTSVINLLPNHPASGNNVRLGMTIEELNHSHYKIIINLDYTFHTKNDIMNKELDAWKSYIIETGKGRMFHNKEDEDALFCVSVLIGKIYNYAARVLDDKGINIIALSNKDHKAEAKRLLSTTILI